MGAYHARIIDKVGALVGGLTYGARGMRAKRTSAKRWRATPNRRSRTSRWRTDLVLLHGKKMLGEAGKLYSRAALLSPRDAMEALDVESARAEME